MSINLEKIIQCVEEYDDEKIVDYVEAALEEGTAAGEILNNGLLKGMDTISKQFKTNEIFVPEVLMAAKTMQNGLSVIKPLLVNDDSIKRKGVAIVGTVKGDLHDIGKRIVAMMMEGSGFEIVDLGVDVSPEEFVNKVKETNADLVLMSAMLTTTMAVMKDVTNRLKEEGCGNCKVMIGGAPVTDLYAEQIGSNYSFDAPSAVDLANQLMEATA
jgi:5-methyltetrahydrofolate--homocysteine methyltransferase